MQSRLPSSPTARSPWMNDCAWSCHISSFKTKQYIFPSDNVSLSKSLVFVVFFFDVLTHVISAGSTNTCTYSIFHSQWNRLVYSFSGFRSHRAAAGIPNSFVFFFAVFWVLIILYFSFCVCVQLLSSFFSGLVIVYNCYQLFYSSASLLYVEDISFHLPDVAWWIDLRVPSHIVLVFIYFQDLTCLQSFDKIVLDPVLLS